jgi:hypothetical protein
MGTPRAFMVFLNSIAMLRLLAVLFLSLTSVAHAATYYIDYVSGSDANSGTSKTAPWQRHPYMKGFAGKYYHSAGDHFIFKGGVTWPRAAFPMIIAGSGSSATANDYYGVDQTWFAGTSWVRPIFNLSGNPSHTVIDMVV